METKKRIGFIIFWLSIVYMAAFGWLGGWFSASAYRNLTFPEISNTIWSINLPLFWFWALSIPVGSIIAGIGLLIYVQAKGSKIWIFGLGFLIATPLVQFLPPREHFPPLFGIFGGLIFTFFVLTVWLWAQKRKILEDEFKSAADFQLTAYIFFISAMWHLCGNLSTLFFKSFEAIPPRTPATPIITLTIGWFFLFLSHYREYKAEKV